MSMSRGCLVIERNPGRWYCIVAHDEHDFYFDGGFNLYGPAESAETAYDEMSARESNPGAHRVVPYPQLSNRDMEFVDNGLKNRPAHRWCR